MDELEATDALTVGERLRAAREEKGLSLDDVAAQTRIPRRHLENVEGGDWEQLPAPTYTIGFAKSYAAAVGLDRGEIGDQLRSEMGGAGMPSAAAEVYEAADPARTMPRWLVLSGVIAVILVIVVMSWLSNRSLHDDNGASPTVAAAPATQSPPQVAAPAAQPAAQGPVVLTATQPVWLAIKDSGHVLKQGIMQPGETYEVPPTATAPVLTTAKSEGLKITVGPAVAPPVGPPATKVSNVSLLGPDLMKGPASPAAAAQPEAKPAPARRATMPAAPQASPAPEPAATPQAPAATTNTGE